jgi:hypothetical protein
MKKLIIVLGLFAAVMVLASCFQQGGTIEVKNVSSSSVEVKIYKGWLSFNLNYRTIAPGKTEIWEFDEDGNYKIDTLRGTPSRTSVWLIGGRTETVKVQ